MSQPPRKERLSVLERRKLLNSLKPIHEYIIMKRDLGILWHHDPDPKTFFANIKKVLQNRGFHYPPATTDGKQSRSVHYSFVDLAGNMVNRIVARPKEME